MTDFFGIRHNGWQPVSITYRHPVSHMVVQDPIVSINEEAETVTVDRCMHQSTAPLVIPFVDVKEVQWTKNTI